MQVYAMALQNLLFEDVREISPWLAYGGNYWEVEKMRQTYRIHFQTGFKNFFTLCGLWCGGGRHSVSHNLNELTCATCIRVARANLAEALEVYE